MRRFGLLAECVDVDTERIRINGKRTHADSPARSSLGGHTASQMNTPPADLECMASMDGANKLVQALRRSQGTQIIADMEKCTDKHVYGGIGRTALRRRPGQTL